MKLEELSRLLRDVDPAAVLVTPPVLSRVALAASGMNWTVWRVPHSHCLTIDRPTLYKHVEQEELYPPDAQPPETVLLLERPSAEQLNGNRNELLGRYWRLLFHASVHRVLEQRLAGLTAAGLRDRIERLGPAAFEEARNVLTQDGFLVPDASDRAVYVEFAAVYLELRYFNPNLLSVCFPSLPPAGDVEGLLTRDADGAALFQRTRLNGALDPAPRTDDQSDESHDFYHRLTKSAQRSAKAGDTVGAAILHTRAARVAPAALTGPAQNAARADIHALVTRLQAALDLSDSQAEPWRRVLPTLLDKADQGTRPVEAALLYDLQRACREDEEPVYSLDVFEWVRSVGQKPIRRELKSQKFVRVPAQLRNAVKRLTAARLSDADRQTLGNLLQDAMNIAEGRLRGEFRPVLTNALLDAGLQPASLPERAALEKSVEELLDHISAVGYVSFGDVRDAIARGQMKLPDLAGPNEVFRGDPLLRLDRRLASLMDGVYRRAESYTRGLERVTSVNFGTQTGRWVTRNVTLPFGVALLAGQFAWLMVFERWKKAERAAAANRVPGADEPGPLGVGPNPPDGEGLKYVEGWNGEWWFHLSWVGLGLVLLAVIRSAALQRLLGRLGRGVYRAARFVVWDVPIRVWANPWVRGVIASVPVQVALNYGVKPLVVSGVILATFSKELWEYGGWPGRVITFAASVLAVNNPIGRAIEAVLLEMARVILEVFQAAPAVLRWINDLFAELLDALEWVLARAEDWLRIRGGRGGPVVVVVKVVAGIVWLPFAFLIRFYTVVLLEPMLNPIKLPLSILFAKFVYPLLLTTPGVLKADDSLLGFNSPLVGQLAEYIPEPAAWLLVMGTIWLLPDALTFLFWEMRENWRLYRANRPSALRPVMVGSHGESIKGLLHYGFHSGTVPRLFAKLRAAERLAAHSDNWRDARTYRQHLKATEEAVRRFVTRDLAAVINPSPEWSGPYLTVGRVELGTNRIRIEIVPAGPGETAWLEWEDRSGWLVAGWAVPGFLADLPQPAARVLGNALAYLYKRAGVGIGREQLRAELPADATHFDIASNGLLVWFGPRESRPLLYDLADPVNDLRPRNPDDLKPTAGPVLPAARLLFGRVQLTWSQWMGAWQSGPKGAPQFGPADWDRILLPPAKPQAA